MLSDPSFMLGFRKIASDYTFLLWRYPEICVAVSSNIAVIPYRLQKGPRNCPLQTGAQRN